jgi:subtilisin family serine protease
LKTKPSTNRIKHLISCGILSILLLCTLYFSMQDFSSVQAQVPLNSEAKIGSDVIETLQLEGKARVVVALVGPFSLNAQPFDLNKTRNEIASLQDSVLSSVDSSDFAVSHQYQAVPALAGTLLTESGLYKLAANPYVSKIDLDVGGTGSLGISVPLIEADTWHDVGNTGNGVVVAILDSGLDTDHTDLASALIHQECFLDNNGSIDGSGLCPNGSDRQSGAGSAEDDAGHGTHVTGIVASRGNQSSIGVAPGTSIVSIKVTAGPSFSGVFFSFSEIVAALDFIINNRPDVQIVNMSLVTNALFSGDCDNSTSWNMAGAAAINTLRSQGVVAFASSGNNGGTLMGSPACLSNVISVGATDNNDVIASFTDSNASTDIMAPGVGVLSSAVGNGTTSASGTSMASPHAAGCAALIIASQEAVTPDEIETRLETSPVQIFDPKTGLTFPRIECSFKSVEAVEINGPITGFTGDNYAFTVNISPITATQPITYMWEATGQSPIINMGGISDTVTFDWGTPGSQVISVTVKSIGAEVTNTHQILINSRNYLPVILK